MIHKPFFVTALLSILLSALSLSACANPSPVTNGWADMPEKHVPALWRVSKGSQTGYLFGSIHALPDDVDWFGPVITEHFDKSDILVMEIDAQKEGAAIAAALQKLGSTKGLGPVKRRIDEQLRGELRALQAASSLKDGALSDREDWAAALALAGVATQGLGISNKYGVERVLGDAARDKNIPIAALETAAQQFGYFDRLPEQAQRAMLESVVAESANAKQAYRDLLASWLTGDVASLALNARSGLMNSDAVRQSLLVDRNRDWQAKIIAVMDRGRTPFVAVGAAHLAGKDSVQEMLAAQGYTITRLQ